MGRPKGSTKITKQKVKEAVSGSFGMIQVIANKLEVNYSTIKRYLDRWPDIAELVNDEATKLEQLAQNTLVKEMVKGGAVGVTAAKFILNAKFRWTEKSEVENTGEQHHIIEVVWGDDAD